MSRRPYVTSKLHVGDVVVRRHRLLKTQGIVLRFDGEDDTGGSRAWIKWSHPNTLPNPSREAVDDLEIVGGTIGASQESLTGATPRVAGDRADRAARRPSG